MKVFAIASLFIAAASAADHVYDVVVGGMGADGKPMLKYQPEYINAEVGDIVRFKFMQKNHTITQSTFADPCKKMDGGADSGFMPNADGKPDLMWEYKVPSKESIWMYCKQKTGNHCGKGMVFSINAVQTGEKTFEAYKQMAMTKYGDAGVVVDAAAKPPCSTALAIAPAAATPAPVVAAAPPVEQPKYEVTKGNGWEKDNACQCSCLCGANTMASGMGVNNWGGMGGMMPMEYPSPAKVKPQGTGAAIPAPAVEVKADSPPPSGNSYF